MKPPSSRRRSHDILVALMALGLFAVLILAMAGFGLSTWSPDVERTHAASLAAPNPLYAQWWKGTLPTG